MICRLSAVLVLAALAACGQQSPYPESRFSDSDRLIARMTANIAAAKSLSLVADIDHARLAADVGSVMTPARVLIFSDPLLESRMIAASPLAALEFPLRALAFEDLKDGGNRVVYNRFDYLRSRYQLGNSPETTELADAYSAAMDTALQGLAVDQLANFSRDEMDPDGIITIDSSYDFPETLARVRAAIDAQDDTLYVGEVDFQANAAALGISLPASHMILFGAPGPGRRAMVPAPTLGLDGFCQKLLIWQGEDGRVHLSFNDLIALAKRQDAAVSVALRIINFRLNSVFGEALAAGQD